MSIYVTADGAYSGTVRYEQKHFQLLVPRSRGFVENTILFQIIKKFPAFDVNPEGSLPCSEQSTPCFYSTPYQSGPPTNTRARGGAVG